MSPPSRPLRHTQVLEFRHRPANAVDQHLHADDGEDEAHESGNDLDAVVANVFDETLTGDEEKAGRVIPNRLNMTLPPAANTRMITKLTSSALAAILR